MAIFVIDDIENLAPKKPVVVIDLDVEYVDGVRKTFLGNGFLAGPAPTDHLKLPDGTPAVNCRLELYTNGTKAAETRTGPDGSWRFDNIDHTLQYDIVAHHHTLEAIISTKRTPSIMPVQAEVIASFVNTAEVVFHCAMGGGMGYGSYLATDLTSSPNVSLVVKDNILKVNIIRVATNETYQIQVESSGVVQPYIIELTAPSL